MVPLFGPAYAASNKGTHNLILIYIIKESVNPPVNGKIRGLFKAFECFSSTFQGKFNFQGLFKTVLYIKVLFKSVRTLVKGNAFTRYRLHSLLATVSISQQNNVGLKTMYLRGTFFGGGGLKLC